MGLVACLIADPIGPALDDELADAAERQLAGERRRLGPDAIEFASELPPAEIHASLARVVGERPIDIAVLPTDNRRKRLLVSDMDSTMITIECIDELADYAGIKPAIAELTRRAMNGEIEFRQALAQRVALLEGLSIDAIDAICRQRLKIMPGAETLVRTMRLAGARCVLVSGGFRQFTMFVREKVGFDLDEANTLEIVNGHLTGRLVGPIQDAESKLASLRHQTEAMSIDLADTVAVGDGANDLPMIRAAGLGVAYRAHPNVRASAPISIQHADLTALLYMQGYRREEFATA